MKRSSIAWTDYSGNVANFILRGKHDCHASEACDNCYMERLDERFGGRLLPEVTTCYPDKLDKLARMRFPQDGNKRGPHTKPMVFVVDGGDLFHESVSDSFIAHAFAVFLARQDVVWQVLTKRAKRMKELLESRRFWEILHRYYDQFGHRALVYPSDNIWLGVTAENQARADERIPLLLQTPAAVRFVSCEPMLGPIDLTQPIRIASETTDVLPGIGYDWIVCGGESGPNARPMHLDWARSLRDQCKAAGTAFFFKQTGGPRPGMGETLDGVMYREWPE